MKFSQAATSVLTFIILLGLNLVTSDECLIPRSAYLPNTVVIPVSQSADVFNRLRYDTSQHVTLEVQNDITDVKWTFNSSYSNTTLISSCGVPFNLVASEISAVPILILNATNIYIYSLNISIAFVTNGDGTKNFAPICNNQNKNLRSMSNWSVRSTNWLSLKPCPPLLIADSDQIQLVGNSIFGPVVLLNLSNTIMDGNYFTSNDNGYALALTNNANTTDLTYYPVIIRNNYFNSSEGILLSLNNIGAAIGVRIYNNRISNFRMSGINFGRYAISNVVMNNLFDRNSLYPVDAISGVMYFNGSRIGVNNTISYNYIHQPNTYATCIFSDNWSSANKISCNICYSKGGVAHRLNMPWALTLENQLYVGSTYTNFSLCNNVQSLCGNDSSSYSLPWNGNQTAWSQVAPWLKYMCNQTISGMPCTTNDSSAQKSGNFSGLGILNSVKVASVGGYIESTKLPFTQPRQTGFSCTKDYPNVDLLNTFNATSYSRSSSVTLDQNTGYIRILLNSTLARDMPCLANFPFNNLGTQAIVYSDIMGIIPIVPNTNSTTANPEGSGGGEPESNDMPVGLIIAVVIVFVIFVGLAVYKFRNHPRTPMVDINQSNMIIADNDA